MSQSTDDLMVDAAAPLDLLLTHAATGMWRRFAPSRSSVSAAAALASRPALVGTSATRLARELTRIGLGRSRVEPERGDRRFTDPAWSSNPAFRAVMQAYLATSGTVRGVVDELELAEQDADRVKFVVDNITDALAPTNIPALSPLFWKAVIDTGGTNVVRGVRNAAMDFASSPRVPTMVDTAAFRIGRSIAATPGAVVLRTAQFELLQYTPTTAQVATNPVLIVPPVINKYYVVDLAPGRSLIEYLVGQGNQVFAISWRNPDVRHRDWGFDVYGDAVGTAIDTACTITGAARTHLLSLCSGGALAAMYAAHLAQTGQSDKIATFSLGVSVLDQSGGGLVNSIADPKAATAAVASSKAKGYLDGAALAEVFAWLRPNDLIWNYWVNNYLQGRRPPAFDILFWNADTTRMTAALHRDFVELFLDNKLTRPGAASMFGTPIDLSTVKADSYIVAGVSDHICPWQSCYQSTQLLGGSSRFVLSRSGHVACLVNPPGNRKATFSVADSTPASATEWQDLATSRQGSWWEDYAAWLAERSDGRGDAPKVLGDDDHPVIEPAPGAYVFDS